MVTEIEDKERLRVGRFGADTGIRRRDEKRKNFVDCRRETRCRTRIRTQNTKLPIQSVYRDKKALKKNRGYGRSDGKTEIKFARKQTTDRRRRPHISNSENNNNCMFLSNDGTDAKNLSST